MNYNHDEEQERLNKRSWSNRNYGPGVGMGIFAVIIAVALAVGGWLLFNEKNDTAGSVVDDASGVASDVYEKGKNLVTPSDQPSSTPN